jgi:hypothetical protein
MKIKMFEYYQGVGVTGVLIRTGATVNVLTPDEVYEVDNATGNYLMDNRKGIRAEDYPEPHYSAKAEPELHDDEALYARMKSVTARTEKEGEENPVMSRSKRGKK